MEGEGGGWGEMREEREGVTIIEQHSIFPIQSRPTTTTYDICCLYNTRLYNQYHDFVRTRYRSLCIRLL
jgi:hypothetical protein